MPADAPYIDKQDQFAKIEAGLRPGEVIHGVFDMKGGGTGFLGVTNRRLIIYDKAFLRKMKAVVSVPYSRVVSIAAQDDTGLLGGRGFFSSSTLVINVGAQSYELEFRGADKAHLAHEMILDHIL